MLKILGNIIFYLAILIAVLSMFQMYIVNKDLVEENNQLKQVNAELQLDYYKMQIQRDEAVDAVWNNNHRQMMEGEGD